MPAWEPVWTWWRVRPAGQPPGKLVPWAGLLGCTSRRWGLALFVNEECVGVDITGRSGRVEVLRTDSGFQFAERALVPDDYVRPPHSLGDRGSRGGRQVAMADGRGGWGPFEQVAEGSHGVLGTAQVRFELGQVGGNDLIAGMKVGGVEHRADVLEGQLEVVLTPRCVAREKSPIARVGVITTNVQSPPTGESSHEKTIE